jgi:4'-phosphopantetheinyl transferase
MEPFALAWERGDVDGHALLRRLAGAQLGIDPAEVVLEQRCPDCGGAHGRPVIPRSRLRVSLARGGGAVVAVAAWDRELGVDVEAREQPPARLAAIREVAGGDGVAHWTRVEAVLKADGRGLGVDPRRVRVDGATASVDGVAYELHEPELAPDLQVTVAVGSLV